MKTNVLNTQYPIPNTQLKVMLNKAIEAVIGSGVQAFVLGGPEQVVKAKAGIAGDLPLIVQEEGIASCSTSIGNIPNVGAVQGIAQGDPVERGRRVSQFHPAPGSADR